MISREPVALRSEPSPELGSDGRIRVDLPHWAAFIEIRDERLEMIDEEVLEESADETVAFARLRPGPYQIVVRLNGQTEAAWANVMPGHTTVLPSCLWSGLALTGAAPSSDLADTSRRSADAARRTSTGAPATLGAGGQGDLYVFLDSAAGKARKLARRLSLIGPDGISHPLRTIQTAASSRGHWCAYRASAQAGAYILRDAGTADRPGRNQAVYLPTAWQTQIFLDTEIDDPLARFSYQIAPRGARFDPEGGENVLAAALLSELSRDGGLAFVQSSKVLSAHRSGQVSDPWLGILTAYACIDDGGDPNAWPLRDALLAMVGEHPDVEALFDPSGSEDAVPLLRLGLQRRLAARPSPPDEDSALAAAARGLLSDSPWTAWRTVAPIPDQTLAFSIVEQTQQALPSSAPIYPVEPRADGLADPVREAKLMSMGFEVLRASQGAGLTPVWDGLVSTGANKGFGVPSDQRPDLTDGVEIGAIGAPTLEDDASLLLLRANEVEARTGEEGEAIAGRLRDIARNLLDRADLMILTDGKGQPLYANGAVQTLSFDAGTELSSYVDGLMRASRGDEGAAALATAPSDSWLTTVIGDEDGHTGEVHMLQRGAAPIDEGVNEQLRQTLDQVMLQSGLLVFGDKTRAAAYRKELKTLVDTCSGLLAPKV